MSAGEQASLFPAVEEIAPGEHATGALPARSAPARPALTAEQAGAVAARTGSRLLYANAGSGKTAVVVERFVEAVLADGVDPRRILAITFTDRAAGELRQRVRARFLELGEREAARAAQGAYVATIHGFCARLLRAHALAAGLDPEFRVLSEPESRRLRGDAFDAALAAFLDAAAGAGPDALELAAAYRPDRLFSLVDSTHARLRSLGQTRPTLPDVAERPLPPELRTRLERAHAAAHAEVEAAGGAMASRAHLALTRCRAALDAAGDGVPSPAELEAARFAAGNARALAGDGCRDYLDALEAYAAAARDRLAARAVRLLGVLLDEYGARYEEGKRRRSGLDFEDLELMARDLLRSDPAVRASYAERFELIMVDEFQDTNARQLELLELLERDNLLTVGDEFQAIYGFRHADVAIFRARRERLEAEGRAAWLSVNFRSRAAILDAVNAAFTPIFGERFVALAPGREDARELAAEPRVELLVTDQSAWSEEDVEPAGGAPPCAPWRRAEARLLAQRVRRLVDAGEARPGEVAVLVRALADLAAYERALEEQGLATYVAGGRGYWSRQQVRDLLAYLRALANPRDELATFELLASPLVGLSSDGLALVARARREARVDVWWALREAFCVGEPEGGGPAGEGRAPGDGAALAQRLPPQDAERLREFCPWFAAERRDAPRRPLAELVERATVARGYDLHVLSLPGGERRMANVRKLMRLAREHEAHEGRDLRAFLDHAARADLEPREGEAPVAGEGLDAVALMTIHAAKGLEFGVVCVADLGRPGPGDHPDLLVSPDGRLGLRLVALDGRPGARALDYDELHAERQAAEDEEERRIFYVALTRARDRLLLAGSVPGLDAWPRPRPCGPPIAWLGPALAPGVEAALSADAPAWDAPTGVRCVLNTPATGALAPPPIRVHKVEPAPPAPERPEPLATAMAGSPRVRALSYTGLESHARCGYRFYAERVLRLPAPDPESGSEAGTEGRDARLRGTIAHLVLERADLARPQAIDASLVDRLAAQAGATAPDCAAEVAALVAGFLDGDLGRRLAGARSLRREVPFAFPLVTPAGEVLLNGVVDAIAREGDRALVVDYKSDRLAPGDDPQARVARDYGVQRAVYALAALRDGAREVEVVHAFLERPDEPVAASFDAAGVPALEAQVAERARRALEGDFAVTDAPHRGLCHDCPARRTLCSWGPEMTLRERPQ
jgi:ATP-dependent exoDNAse (exonuclease V) beta subunit